MNDRTCKKMITCIVSVGVAKPVMRELYKRFNILQMQFNFARGIGKRTHTATQGWDEKAEKEILSVTVHADIAEQVFDFLFYETQINLPHHGIMYMHDVIHATSYSLPKGLELSD